MTLTLIEANGIAKHQIGVAHHGKPMQPLELALLSACLTHRDAITIRQGRTNIFHLMIGEETMLLSSAPPYTEIRVTTPRWKRAQRVEIATLTSPAEVYEWVAGLSAAAA